MNKTSVAESSEEGIPPPEDDTVVKQHVQKNWRSYIWDTLDKSPEERKFLFKLDAALLSFASLGEYSTHGKGESKADPASRIFHQIP